MKTKPSCLLALTISLILVSSTLQQSAADNISWKPAIDCTDNTAFKCGACKKIQAGQSSNTTDQTSVSRCTDCSFFGPSDKYFTMDTFPDKNNIVIGSVGCCFFCSSFWTKHWYFTIILLVGVIAGIYFGLRFYKKWKRAKQEGLTAEPSTTTGPANTNNDSIIGKEVVT